MTKLRHRASARNVRRGLMGPGGKTICYPCFEQHPEWEAEAVVRSVRRLMESALQ